MSAMNDFLKVRRDVLMVGYADLQLFFIAPLQCASDSTTESGGRQWGFHAEAGAGQNRRQIVVCGKDSDPLGGGHDVRVTDLLARNWWPADQKLADCSPLRVPWIFFFYELNVL
jgi:hypothetical protein